MHNHVKATDFNQRHGKSFEVFKVLTFLTPAPAATQIEAIWVAAVFFTFTAFR